MALLMQTMLVSCLNLASLRERLGTSLVIVVGMACVTCVLVSMLSVTVGMLRVYAAAGDPTRAIVLSARSRSEFGTDLDRVTVATIMNAPGIAKSAAGKPLADGELLLNMPPVEGFQQGSLALRGIGAAGIALRPEFRIVAGRMFERGRQEVIVGAGAQRVFGLAVGDRVILPDGEWPIVGAFEGGGVLESQLMADADTLMASVRRTAFGSVLVRLESADSFAAFRSWLTSNPTLELTVERHSDFYEREGGRFTLYRTLALLVGVIMSIGALFGAVNILHSVVGSRAREIATLRALGYEPFPVAASVITEGMVLALAGAVIGTSAAWLMFDGHQSVIGSTIFTLSVSPGLIAMGIGWALLLALIGSVFPALRAARLPVAQALRAV